MAEKDVSRREYDSQMKHVEDRLHKNEEALDKLSLILLGNGETGVVGQISLLMMRNAWLDKGVNVAVGILASLLTLYITGVLQL